jgi:hypothetical protein
MASHYRAEALNEPEVDATHSTFQVLVLLTNPASRRLLHHHQLQLRFAIQLLWLGLASSTPKPHQNHHPSKLLGAHKGEL